MYPTAAGGLPGLPVPGARGDGDLPRGGTKGLDEMAEHLWR